MERDHRLVAGADEADWVAEPLPSFWRCTAAVCFVVIGTGWLMCDVRRRSWPVM